MARVSPSARVDDPSALGGVARTDPGSRRNPRAVGVTRRRLAGAGPFPSPPRERDRWASEVGRFLAAKAVDTPVGENWMRRIRWELLRVPGLLNRLDPSLAPRAALDLGSEHIAALRNRTEWEKATLALHFAALRPFLRWVGNPVAQARGVWRLPSGQSTHRRWLDKAQLSRLYTAARGRAKLLVALEGLNGLRRVEVLRLRREDVLLGEGCLRVLGKGRDGGKWRTIPIHPLVQSLLVAHLADAATERRLFPLSASGADLLLRNAADAAGFAREGIRVSHHDLRRTFGRVAYQSGMDLIQLKNLFGHASVEMTVHYIGIDTDRMRTGLNRVRLRLPRTP